MSWDEPSETRQHPALETLIISRTRDLGDGFEVRRALPSTQRRMVGPFIFLDQMGPSVFRSGQGLDVRPHPHINLATVTYLFAGAIDHRDSLGTFATIEPGAVNLMTAGRGIAHSERSPAHLRPGGPELSGIQTWLALPRAKEEIDPAFEHVPRDRLPVVDGGGARARVVMGSLWGSASPVTCHSETMYADIRLEAGGARLLIDGREQAAEGLGEYPDIYRRFVDLIDERRSLVDVAPLRLVADCLLPGRRHIVEPFSE